MMAKPESKDAKPGAVQVETARRLLRAHGVDDAAFTKATKTAKQKLDIPADADAAEAWLLGSIPQLRRWWGGRCLTCAHWSDWPADGLAGTCRELTASKDGIYVVGTDGTPEASTLPTFGCILWAELPEDDATLRARTELAMALGLLPTMPEDDA